MSFNRMPSNRIIFHIDVNSAFLSWESVYRLSQDPSAQDLREIPSAVGGDQASRRGVVLAKSTPAKKYGVTTGEPLTQALKKCPQLVIVPSRFEYYHQASQSMIRILEEYTPDIEKFSIDEAFLDMTTTIHLFGEPVAAADQIRARIHRELGFTVNVGVAPNKLLAKMASDFQKPDRTHTLWEHEIPEKLWPLPVRDLFFVGSSAEKKMQAIGIRTIGDLARCDLSVLKAHLGEKYAVQIHRYANGIDEDPVAEKEPVGKGYGNSTTLPSDVNDYETACQILLSLCETVGIRLRRDHVQCGCVCVELRDYNFHDHSHQMTLDAPTDSTTILYESSCRLLKEFWDLTPVRLIGVRATRISDESYAQMNLFDTKRKQKLEKIDKAIDAIRGKYGADSIKRASSLNGHSVTGHIAGKEKHLPNSSEDPSDNDS